MKPMSLDLSRFHKVRADKDTTTFRSHDAPHEITVAHKALPREMRSYLNALPMYDADQADPEQKLARGGVADALKKKRPPQASQEKLASAMQHGGRAYYDDGTPNKTAQPDDATPAPTPAATPININIGSAPQSLTPEQLQANMKQYQDTQTQAKVADQSKQADAQAASMPYGAAPDTQYGTATPLPAPQAQSTPTASDAAVGNTPAQTADAAPAAQQGAMPASTPAPLLPNPMTAPGNNYGADPSVRGGLQEQIQGGDIGASTAGELGRQAVPLYTEQARNEYAVANNIQNANAAMTKERQLLEQEASQQKIGPEHYWANHSKVLTGLGILLAGFNPTNQPNAAVSYLQNAIKQDTDAQATKIGATNNLLAHYATQFGNVQHAMEFVNSAKKDAIASKLEAQASKMADPVQRAKFLQWAGQLRNDAGIKLAPYAMAQGINDSINQGIDLSSSMPYLRAVNPELARGVDSVTLPGQGYFNKPVPPELISNIAAKNNIIQASQNLRKFIDANTDPKTGLFNTNPDPRVRAAVNAQAETYGNELHGYYRKAYDASTSQGEAQNIDKVVGKDPTGFFTKFTTDPKLQALENSINSSIQSYKDTYGFTPLKNAKGAAPYTSPVAQPPQTPAPQTPPVQMAPMGRKMYRKVPGGWVPA